MKTTKTFVFLFFLILALSCNFSTSQNEGDTTSSSNTIEIVNSKLKNKFNYHKIYDPQNGMVTFQMPLPKDWKYNSKKDAEITITAPNNIKVNKSESQEYAYANNQFSMQIVQQMTNGKDMQISPVVPLNQILQKYIIPSAQLQGYNLIKSYPLPNVLSFWDRYEAGMLKTGRERHFNVLGTDWEDSNGNKSFIVLLQGILKDDRFTYWSLTTTELESPEAHFNKAKDDFIYAMANTQINMQWQNYKNRKLLQSIRNNQIYWENATRQSQIAHNQRMSAISSAGNTSRSIGNTYSDILDISHAGYLKRDNINSSGQSKSINMIGERSVISSMATGERYNVEAGSKYYWVNNDGGYFGTDNAFYDPRIDKRLNNSEWSQFEIDN